MKNMGRNKTITKTKSNGAVIKAACIIYVFFLLFAKVYPAYLHEYTYVHSIKGKVSLCPKTFYPER